MTMLPMWISIVGCIILVCCSPPCVAVRGCTVILRNQKSTMKKAVCNMPNSNLDAIPLDLPHALVELDISFQNLQTIRNREFISIPDLESLSITSSNVRTIEEGAFVTLSKLASLILTNNSLIVASDNVRSLSKSVFLPLINLKFLDLSFNFVGKIPDYFFNHLNKTLETLQLSHSKSELILGLNSLNHLGMLRSLKLEYSQIKSINDEVEESLNVMSNLKELLIIGNLWHCDCQLKWFILWMVKKFQLQSGIHSKSYELICSSPQSIKNKNVLGNHFRLIENKPFECVPEAMTNNSMVTAHIGRNISLTCSYRNTDENYKILWKNHRFTIGSTEHEKRYQITETRGKLRKSMLTIINFTRAEEGTWKCLVNYHEKSIEVDFLINVDQSSDQSLSTLRTSSMSTKTSTVYAMLFTTLIVITIILILILLYYFKYYKGSALWIGNRSQFNILTKNKTKNQLFKIKSTNNHTPLNPFSLTKDPLKMEDKIYDNVPISSGFYINFTKKKNEQNFSTLNCMDCQNYAIVDDSLTINSSQKAKSPRFWYLDDSVDGVDYMPSSFALDKDLDLTDISDKDSAFITRIPSKTPCPVHSSQSSMSNFKKSLSDFSNKISNSIAEIESCPIHGKKNFQNSYSVHFSIPDQQLNKPTKHMGQPPQLEDNLNYRSLKKSSAHSYFPVYLSSVDVKDGTQSRPYSCLTNSAV